MNDLLIEQINGLYPCRGTQINQLYHHLNQFPPLIIIDGYRGTAKSSIVKCFINTFQIFHVWINCTEIFNQKMLFELILSQLSAKLKPESESKSEYYRCNGLSDFMKQFKQIMCLNELNNKCVLVFDNSEQLVNSNHDLITIFSNFKSLINEQNSDNYLVTTLFISNQSLDCFYRNASNIYPCIEIHFANYDKQQMTTILMNYFTDDQQKQLYSDYLNIMLSSLTPYTRNFTEILYFCLNNYHKYTEQMDSEESKNKAKLFKRFKPILEQLIEKLSLKVETKVECVYELPYCVKYLLISAYLSSFNTVKSDKKIFVKYQEKRKNTFKKSTNNNEEISGPKAFTFERMIQIYCSILRINGDDYADQSFITSSSNKLLSQFEELIELKLVHRITSTNKSNYLSSVAKYIISNSITFDMIKTISNTLKFDITSVLE